ncbi:MAG: hypothetical protein U0231_08040 [Nitrospiraceae bacterium]
MSPTLSHPPSAPVKRGHVPVARRIGAVGEAERAVGRLLYEPTL